MSERSGRKNRRLVGNRTNRLKSGSRRCQIESLETRSMLAASPLPQLVKDLNLIPLNSNPDNFVTVGKFTYFTANDGVHGNEIWKSDGTKTGTTAIRSGKTTDGHTVAFSAPLNLTAIGGTLFFTAKTEGVDSQLWKTNGTASGTVQVTDFRNQIDGAQSPSLLTNVDGTLYFVYRRNKDQLWRSNGTAAGTKMLLETSNGGFSSLTNVDGRLFFVAKDSTHGRELWTTSGSAAGTRMVKDIFPGTGDSDLQDLRAVDGNLFFTADDGVHGREVWTSDGTRAGTHLVAEVNPGDTATSTEDPVGIATVRNKYYFVSEQELWRTDGTEAGTKLIADLSTLGRIGFDTTQRLAISVENTLYFVVHNYDLSHQQLWKTDGTRTGTVAVGDISDGSGDLLQVQNLKLVKGSLFLTVARNVNTNELWSSDGTAPGTGRVENLSGAAKPIAPNLGVGTIYFANVDAAHGNEFWRSNGSATGTTLVRDINRKTASSPIGETIEIGGQLLFAVNGFQDGAQLWASDGTAQGTKLVKTIMPGPTSDQVANFVDVDGRLFFTMGSQLWTSDGTTDGTKNLGPFFGISNMTALGGSLYFFAHRVVQGSPGLVYGLWKSDGTMDGAGLVEEYDSNDVGEGGNLTNVDGTLFYTTNRTLNSQFPQLWSTDGVPGHAVQLGALPSGGASAAMAGLNGKLYLLIQNSDANRYELWSSNGTVAGTNVLLALPQAQNRFESQFLQLVEAGGRLFFTADDGQHGIELWTSNGTPQGTRLVRDLIAGNRSGAPNLLTTVGGKVYFNAGSDSGRGLWTSDGTTKGTIKLTGATAKGFGEVNGVAYFAAGTSKTGTELWRSDSTVKGTKAVMDINPGTESSFPLHFATVNDQLFFTADDGEHGRELWMV
jgi:ELWxxDGT repeat protein